MFWTFLACFVLSAVLGRVSGYRKGFARGVQATLMTIYSESPDLLRAYLSQREERKHHAV